MQMFLLALVMAFRHQKIQLECMDAQVIVQNAEFLELYRLRIYPNRVMRTRAKKTRSNCTLIRKTEHEYRCYVVDS